MTIARLIVSVSVVGVLALAGCSGKGQVDSPRAGDSQGTVPTLSKENAVEIAVELGAENGYPKDEYYVTAVESSEDGESWWVDFKRKGKARLGEHFSVTVSKKTGKAELFHGR
jgi:hypothetical protein